MEPTVVDDTQESQADPALLAEADAAIAGAEPEVITEEGQPVTQTDPAQAAEEFRVVLKPATVFVAKAVLPQWGISEDMRAEWEQASAECLAMLFPDGINGKYACWFRLIACTTIIAANGIAQNGGKIPGIGPKHRDPAEVIEHGTASAA